MPWVIEKDRESNIKDSIWTKYGIYAGILVAIIAVSQWLDWKPKDDIKMLIVVLILLGAVVIWIDHRLRKLESK